MGMWWEGKWDWQIRKEKWPTQNGANFVYFGFFLKNRLKGKNSVVMFCKGKNKLLEEYDSIWQVC